MSIRILLISLLVVIITCFSNVGAKAAHFAPIRVVDDGSVFLRSSREVIAIETFFQSASGGYHWFASGGGGVRWKRVLLSARGGEYKINGYADNYEVQRIIRIDGDRKVTIEDTIINLRRDRDIGLAYGMRLDIKKGKLKRLYVGGSESCTLRNVPANPTIFARTEDIGVGLVVEDNVVRLQGEEYCGRAGMDSGIRTNMLSVNASGSYTSKWTLLLGASDYYAYINQLRTLWNVEVPVDGMFSFVSADEIVGMDDEVLRRRVDRSGIKYLVIQSSWHDAKTGEVKSYFGFEDSAIFDAGGHDYRRYLSEAIVKLRRVAPEVKVLGKVHSYHNIMRRADHLDMSDSVILNEDGKHVISKRYGYVYYPTTNNAMGREFMKLVKWFVEDMHLDGVFWDEMEAPGVMTRSKPQGLFYTLWDDHTAVVGSKDNRILRKAALIGLVSDALKKSVVRYLQKKNKVLMGNGMPTTLSFNKMHFARLVELHRHLKYASEAHLYSALGYYEKRPSLNQVVDLLERGVIPIRIALGYKAEYIRNMYPITITQLHHGYICGVDSVVATRWPLSDDVCDTKGRLLLGYSSLSKVSPTVAIGKDQQGIYIFRYVR